MPKQTLIAKINRPRLLKVLFRRRLFGLLHKGRRAPLTWVCGPAGSGKTTLVASYLDAKKLPALWYHLDEGDGDIATFFYYMGLAAKKAAPHFKKPLPLLTLEYLFGIPTFTKRYFENLCSRLKPPFVIVLDNYHVVAPDSPFHDVVRDALSVIPEGITVIVNSRGAPPPGLALLSAYNKIHYVGADDLKFDISETRALIGSLQTRAKPGTTAGRLHRITEGWAAGLVLLLERMRTSGAAPDELDRFRPEELFDYFATEMFEKTDTETQIFLLKTAFLPRISPKAAVELTGNDSAGTVLAALSRNHFFTERRSMPESVYQYHPLFREFLLERARETYSRGETRDIMVLAAQLLEGEGQVEDAAELWRISEEWGGLVRLILANAASMASQGRSRPLEEWLKSLPERITENDPWLLYWMGVCRMPFGLLEARKHFEKAFSLFRKRRDASGVFLAWSGAVESFIQELDVSQMDSWIALLDDLVKEYPAFPSPQIEGHVTTRIFIALSMRQPWHPAFVEWRDKAIALIDSKADPTLRMLCGFYLIIHLLVVGDVALCERVMSTMRVIINSNKNISPLAYIAGKFADGWMAWTTSSYEHSLKTMDEGLQMSKDSGVHLWDYLLLGNGSFAALMTGDVHRSKKLLGQMAYALELGRPLDKFYYYWFESWHSMLNNDVQGAIALASASIELVTKLGILGGEARGRLAQAHYMHMTGNYSEAKEHISKSRSIGQKMKSSIIVFCCDLEASAVAFTEGDEEAGLQSLRNAMSLGREKGYPAFNFAFFQNEELSFLCVKALEAGIEPAFVTEMIRKRNLVPETPPVHIENWPWPIKIFTLGRFEIVRDGKPLHFTGKVQKKPLEMLKVLIAFGGQNVSEHRFIDALWPDADGDTSCITFKSTLHRLRKLLGREEIIQFQEGRMSLNQRCWVDAQAFERMVEIAESGRREAASQTRQSSIPDRQSEMYPLFLEKAVNMYRGHFLGEEGDNPWATSLKERLRGKYLRTVNALGEYWLRQGGEKTTPRSNQASQSAIKKAIECFERGLEIDDTAEELYQNLIVSHIKLWNKAEAARAYKRCCDALSSTLGVEPSEKTRLLCRELTLLS